MDIYLMQHGVAATAEEDPSRPLTADGRAAVERVARQARDAGVRIDVCVHSGKARAEQTATILAAAVGGGVRARAGLDPSDPVQPVADWLEAQAVSSVAVVGHLPFLDHLASLLVAGRADAHAVPFRHANLVKLVPREDADGYVVEWVLTPGLP